MGKTINEKIQRMLQESLKNLFGDKIPVPSIEIEMSKKEEYGDYTTNIALRIAKLFGQKPMNLAEWIVKELEKNNDIFKKIEIVHPGFINFFLNVHGLLYILEFELDKNKRDKLKVIMEKHSNKSLLEELLNYDKIKSIQYVHSRTYSILKIFEEEGLSIENIKNENIDYEMMDFEKMMIKKIAAYPQVIKQTVTLENPEEIVQYVLTLCELFYKFQERILFRKLEKDRLYGTLKVIYLIKIIMKQVLDDFGLDAPEKM